MNPRVRASRVEQAAYRRAVHENLGDSASSSTHRYEPWVGKRSPHYAADTSARLFLTTVTAAECS